MDFRPRTPLWSGSYPFDIFSSIWEPGPLTSSFCSVEGCNEDQAGEEEGMELCSHTATKQ